MSPALSTAISSIGEDDWTLITYPHAVWDDTEQRLVAHIHEGAALTCGSELLDVDLGSSGLHVWRPFPWPSRLLENTGGGM